MTALFLALLLALAPWPAGGAEDVLVRIGVLAKRGPEMANANWGPTAEYLTREIPGYRFVIVPLSFQDVRGAVEAGQVDFIITNSSYYVELESLYGVSRIATLKNRLDGRTLSVFGGVVFTRSDRQDLMDIKSLSGLSFSAVDKDSFGGWLACRCEMARNGVDPEKGDMALGFAGTHDAVVYAVLEGRADAGCVRTDTLERMAAEGRVRLSDLRIVNSYPVGTDFPFLRSTLLYPEWPWAKLRSTSDDLAEKTAIALLRMPPGDEAARAAEIAGWTVPLDYQPVHDLMKELKVGPYQDLGRVTPEAVFREYFYLISGSLAVLLALTAITGALVRFNRKLNRARADLGRELENRLEAEKALNLAYEDLEAKVRERTAELYRQNELGDSIIRAASAAIVTLDSAGRVTRFNEYAERLTGRLAADVLGRDWVDICTVPEVRGETAARLKSWLMGGNPQWSYEGDLIQLDGALRVVSWQVSLLRDASGELLGALAIGLDVTSRRLAEEKTRLQQEQLIHADKMVALGTLVAGVAHEINNPTTSIMMNAPNVEKMWEGLVPVLEDYFNRHGDFTVGAWSYEQVRQRLPLLLEGIADGAKRVKRIVADLKDYARQEGSAGAVPVDVNHAVGKAMSLLSNLIKKASTRFSVRYGDDLPPVLAQSQRLEQVVINLVMNACQALPSPDRGVTVTTEYLPEDDAVRITVRDEGVGIPAEHLSRLTDPFFTTRRESGGTGLGLAISSRIVKDCGGRLIFESREGEGSLVTVELPVTKPTQGAPPDADALSDPTHTPGR